MRKTFERYLRLNVGERRGALAFLAISVLLLALSSWMRHLQPQMLSDTALLEEKSQHLSTQITQVDYLNEQVSFEAPRGSFDPNTASVADLQDFGLPAWLAQRIDKYRKKGGKFKQPGDLAKIYGMPTELYERLAPFVVIAGNQAQSIAEERQQNERFEFDPNTTSEAEFLRLGLSERVVKSIMNYRNKGGGFRYPDDFGKIYGLQPEIFETLKPLIRIEPTAPTMYASPGQPNPTIKVSNVDINAASVADWQSLPGVGPVFAERIIKYRNALGGFAQVETVAETRYLPDSVFQKIRPYLKASEVTQKLRINYLDEKTLNKHPYFDALQSKLIVAWRNQHGPLKQMSEIGRAIPTANADWLEKVEPYIQFD